MYAKLLQFFFKVGAKRFKSKMKLEHFPGLRHI
jgi:hypothetical protein